MVGLLEELELFEIPGWRSKRAHGLFLVFHTSRLPDSARMSGGEGEEVLCACTESEEIGTERGAHRLPSGLFGLCFYRRVWRL